MNSLEELQNGTNNGVITVVGNKSVELKFSSWRTFKKFISLSKNRDIKNNFRRITKEVFGRTRKIIISDGAFTLVNKKNQFIVRGNMLHHTYFL